MNKIDLSSNLLSLKIVNAKHYQLLKQIDITNIYDMLYYFPIRYDNYSLHLKINRITPDQSFHLIATVQSINTRRSFRRGLMIGEVTVKDDTGFFKLTFFNNRFLAKMLTKNETYLFLCRSTASKYGTTITNPIFYHYSKKSDINLINPVYSESKAIKSAFIKSKISKIIHLSENIDDFLPAEITKREKLISLSQAIKTIHFPDSEISLHKAIKRISFDEIFLMQLGNFFQKSAQAKLKSYPIKFDLKHLQADLSHLPFALTNYQKKSLWEILQDLDSTKPMNRLLEGDVGSGKTIIAALAISQCIKAKFLAVLIAPTEILAIQHFRKIFDYLKIRKYNFGLFTQNNISLNDQKISKTEFLKKLKNGQIDLVIATHAIWHLDFAIPKLNLVIIDEQHRFGVRQRNLLTENSQKVPHTLTMSATPIPRTLALSVFGHIKISQIKSLPKGRKPIITKIIHPDHRLKTYQFIKDELKKGRQGFVICPLVEESEKLTVKSVTAEYALLTKIFSEFKVGLIHGQLKDNIKDQVMTEFAANKIQLLVSTSVIEVGIDIPNANIILIEGSERFGLSQLHQFRGRVGRGEYQSYCFLFTDLPSPKVISRLHVLVNTNDGFEIAEADLKLRGPGDMSGLRQSGLPDLKMASLSDQKIIETSLKAVQELLEKDPNLSNHPALLAKISHKNNILN